MMTSASRGWAATWQRFRCRQRSERCCCSPSCLAYWTRCSQWPAVQRTATLGCCPWRQEHVGRASASSLRCPGIAAAAATTWRSCRLSTDGWLPRRRAAAQSAPFARATLCRPARCRCCTACDSSCWASSRCAALSPTCRARRPTPQTPPSCARCWRAVSTQASAAYRSPSQGQRTKGPPSSLARTRRLSSTPPLSTAPSSCPLLQKGCPCPAR
mmetsp:Transcript_9403/g.23811  ORF Transcript_9403/g.23811 Transcript_9403/m.23811 type:complete len:214 (+) Transcript_9403:2348-2989(+)